MSQVASWLTGILEVTGLDWFVEIFRKPNFEKTKSPYPTEPEEIQKRLGNLEEAKLEEAVEYCSNLLKREEDRIAKVESKAFTLMGITGIGTGLITGFAKLLFDVDSILMSSFLAVLFGLTVICLMMTLMLSFRVIKVGEYKLAYPNPNIVFKLKDTSLDDVQLQITSSLFQSFTANQGVANIKATYLGGAQIWFRNSVILLLLIALALAVYMPLKGNVASTPRNPGTPIERTLPTKSLGLN